jgi:hypothetical protein
MHHDLLFNIILIEEALFLRRGRRAPVKVAELLGVCDKISESVEGLQLLPARLQARTGEIMELATTTRDKVIKSSRFLVSHRVK